jgi:hypothetical protein
LDPAPQIDSLAMFADDGIIMGTYTELVRTAGHLTQHMPKTGLHFGKMQLVPAAPDGAGAIVDQVALQAAGATFVPDGNFEVTRSPIGGDDWCREYTSGSAQTTLDVYAELAHLDSHVSFYLTKYQLGRANYILRTTPPRHGLEAATTIDHATQALVQGWLGRDTSEQSMRHALLPQRLGGLGLMSCRLVADAAYVASREQTADLCKALQISRRDDMTDVRSQFDDRDLQLAAERLARTGGTVTTQLQENVEMTHSESWLRSRSQKALVMPVLVAEARRAWVHSHEFIGLRPCAADPR